MLGGGIPPGSSLLFSAYPGVECEAFGYQTLKTGLETEKECFIFTNVSEPINVLYKFSRYGWNINEELHKGNLFFVDGISHFIGSPIDGKYGVENHFEVLKVINNAINDIPNGVGVINNLSTIIDYLGEEKTLEYIRIWNRIAKENNSIIVYVFTQWDYPYELISNIERHMDCVIDLNPIEDRVIIGQGFMVTQTTWNSPKSGMEMFVVLQPGGVNIYIPKVIVTGPYHAGKSSFISSLSHRAVPDHKVNYLPSSVAFDVGEIDYNGFNAHILGSLGHERFELLLDCLSNETMGAFILIDSTEPDTFARAKEMINRCEAEAIPKVVVANKQDLPTAMSPSAIRNVMNLSNKIPIIPATLKDCNGFEEALDALIYLIYGGF
jgi:small GTP-binding protein